MSWERTFVTEIFPPLTALRRACPFSTNSEVYDGKYTMRCKKRKGDASILEREEQQIYLRRE
ncbi:hypothetical protein K443DRAFT_676946 [Laccaria amethystina LaAM-08-1]|uniref:Uncharacterized protein n=1 Tax=Laccaria amethystina LaAM-08-1 TaxID=1095629 RepID=A0A0C9Y5D2_9AGAR|nr:hypothetical protein K443DRAFT_676946 [Laccaria amethystina LaAM-08-1]